MAPPTSTFAGLALFSITRFDQSRVTGHGPVAPRLLAGLRSPALPATAALDTAGYAALPTSTWIVRTTESAGNSDPAWIAVATLTMPGTAAGPTETVIAHTMLSPGAIGSADVAVTAEPLAANDQPTPAPLT